MKIFKQNIIRVWALLLVASLSFMACNSSTDENTTTNTDSTKMVQSDSMVMAQATISPTYTDTAVEGSASFHQMDGKVEMVLQLTIPSKANSSVAVHLHEHGDCGDMGKEAHGHWNPTNKNHGKWGSESFHAGDIGNVQLDKDGKGSLTMETNLWTIGGDSTTNILGRAVIVHGGVDDFITQPTGNAGGRIGCGVISK